MAEVEVTLLLFAKAKEIVGQPELAVRLPSVISAESLKEKLLALCPALEKLGKTFIVAHNENYVESGQLTLRSGDELAIIPPISGG